MHVFDRIYMSHADDFRLRVVVSNTCTLSAAFYRSSTRSLFEVTWLSHFLLNAGIEFVPRLPNRLGGNVSRQFRER